LQDEIANLIFWKKELIVKASFCKKVNKKLTHKAICKRMKDTYLAAVNVWGIEKIKWQCCYEVNKEPAFHVIHGDASAIADDFALSTHVRCSEVQNDIWGGITEYTYICNAHETIKIFRTYKISDISISTQQISKILIYV